MDVGKDWVTGPVLELMLKVARADEALSPDPGIFQAGDEVLVTDYDGGVPFVGVLVLVDLHEGKPPRLRIAQKGHMSRMQWGWWSHVLGWRRPHG